MINFVNRVPTQPNRKKVTKEDGSIEYMMIEYADEPTDNGTPINRYTLMAMQGFINSTIQFESNGDIVQIFTDGSRLLIQFLPNGDIKETLSDNKGRVTIRTIKFQSSGNIKTEVS